MQFDERQLKAAMKKMGIQQVDVDATEVIIKTPEKELVIRNPKVAKVTAMGKTSFQIDGVVEERQTKNYTEQDVTVVAEKAGVSEKEAEEALNKTKGDIAEAILMLTEE